MTEQAAEVDQLRASDGRVPGRRGRATRQRLLDCTAEMLRTTSYRAIKVIDIAREAGTSPATFYQYFPDVESAILVLADDMVAKGVVRFAAALNNATWSVHEIAQFVYTTSGSSALRNGTVQRLFRDVHGGTQHISSSPMILRAAGRELAGLAEGQRWVHFSLK